MLIFIKKLNKKADTKFSLIFLVYSKFWFGVLVYWKKTLPKAFQSQEKNRLENKALTC